ncbi:2-aminoethanethiol dioxygenase-like [Asterias rubens]|uniref:2-aminoethanethiol dioxygenase-like n=1 Tax=Asterias rubens TaxID=7604 RepID=UPI0014558131|nr:2-aminoethanethiol dioxygenase-like [Asterias rubens]
MANLQPIQKVAKLALETFKYVNKGDKHVFLDKLESLCASVNRIRAADVGVDLTANALPPVPATAPVGYMFIAENSAVSMGVFVVERGCRLPLHDHNGMHGVIKVLSGTIRMHSYDLLTEDEVNSIKIPDSLAHPNSESDEELMRNLIPVRKKAEAKIITPESKPCVLSPMESNVHSLESIDGPAAFLDVLSPPYDPDTGRDCVYYTETPFSSSNLKLKETPVDLRWLLRIPQPSSFWCHQQSYLGPPVNLGQL